jgi:uncharacterized protein
MKISGIVWLQKILDKVAIKHGLTQDEVEEVFGNKPEFRFLEDGDIAGEDVYSAYGRTHAGRYLTVIFVMKSRSRALIISARDMDRKERRRYGK